MFPYKILKNKEFTEKQDPNMELELAAENGLGHNPALVVKERLEPQQHFVCYVSILAVESSST